MVATSSAKRVEQAETEIAVIHVRLDNIDEKMSDLRSEVKDLHDCLDRNMDETKLILKEFQDSNKKSHDSLEEKISSMEKVKWMLMGAAAVLGASGVEAFKMIING